jgi:hypothetical protein
MKSVDIADELYRELSSPAELSIPAISFWLRTNLGILNNHINASYHLGEQPDYEIQHTYIDSNGASITEEINEEAKSVLKRMYFVHYYENKLTKSLSDSVTDSVISVSDDGSSVRKVNKNEVSKVYLKLLRTEMDELKKLIFAYQRRGAEPIQVAGDDTIAGYYDADRPVDFSGGDRRNIR